MLDGILLVLLGALAVPQLIAEKKPELAPKLEALARYAGWLGVAGVAGGLWGLLVTLLGPSWAGSMVWWLSRLAADVTLVALGLLLGVETLKAFFKSEATQLRLDDAAERIAPFRSRLGVAAIALGAWCVVAAVIFR